MYIWTITNWWCIDILKEGQAISAKLPFKNGTIARYNRPYLITKVYRNNEVDLIDVSSVKGKEHKLLFPTNHELSIYNPPFLKPSFVKLDSLRKIDSGMISYALLHKGELLNSNDLNEIRRKLYR